MQALIKKAKQEGTLVIVAGPNDASYAQPVWNVFAKQFGIKLSLVTGSPTDISTRILAENQQGLHQVDIGIMGNGSTTRIAKAGLFQPLVPKLVLPEAKNRSTGWRLKYIPWDPADPTGNECTDTLTEPLQGLIQTYYNTQNVTASDLKALKTWSDLLSPKYKGKIVIGDMAADVDSSDRLQSWAILGKSFFTKFMNTMDVQVVGNGADRQMADDLTRGQYDFAMFPGSSDPFQTAISQGLPVAQLPLNQFKQEAPGLGGRVCLFKTPANPAAAQLFVNWVMSKAGQTAYNLYDTNKAPEEVSLRTDVPRGNRSAAAWKAASLPTNKPFDVAKYPTALNDSLTWWQQEFNRLHLNP
jgi:ABC-type Fe3+ transport system substrate-binding protein